MTPHCLGVLVHKSYELCENLTFELLLVSNTACGNLCKPQIIYILFRGKVVIKRKRAWMTSWIKKKNWVCQIWSFHDSTTEDLDLDATCLIGCVPALWRHYISFKALGNNDQAILWHISDLNPQEVGRLLQDVWRSTSSVLWTIGSVLFCHYIWYMRYI